VEGVVFASTTYHTGDQLAIRNSWHFFSEALLWWLF
jgi:hypothetical protein